MLYDAGLQYTQTIVHDKGLVVLSLGPDLDGESMKVLMRWMVLTTASVTS